VFGAPEWVSCTDWGSEDTRLAKERRDRDGGAIRRATARTRFRFRFRRRRRVVHRADLSVTVGARALDTASGTRHLGAEDGGRDGQDAELIHQPSAGETREPASEHQHRAAAYHTHTDERARYENFFTGLLFHRSNTSKASCTCSFGFGAAGATVRSRWNPVGSGIPATSAMPHRGHLPGLLERMSASMGQTYATSLDGSGAADDRGCDRVAVVSPAAEPPGLHAHKPFTVIKTTNR